MKIVKNNCYGGFSVSKEVALKLAEKYPKIKDIVTDEKCIHWTSFTNGTKKSSVYLCNEDFNIKSDNYMEYRTNKDLIKAIEETEHPSGALSNLCIVDIPDDIKWEIDDYDGIETIREVKDTW